MDSLTIDRIEFQSTLPVKGATYYDGSVYSEARVSIHAPREGSDAKMKLTILPQSSFNPRSP